ncbi:MAG: prenyltransferase [Spirochaetia bacterium]
MIKGVHAKLQSSRRLRSAARVIGAVRPWSFSMTAISVAFGILAAGAEGRIHWWLAAASLAGALCMHAATNLGNDYFDFQTGIDAPGSPSVRGRRHPLVERTLEPWQVLGGAIGFWSAALLIGIALSFLRGWPIALLTSLGVLAGYFYSAGPVRLKARALGEITAFFMWGPFMVLGAFYVQRAAFSGSRHALLLSVMQGLWVAQVLLANNLRDVEADTAMGIRTPATILGRQPAAVLAVALAAGAYLLDAAAVLLGILAPWALLVFLSAPLAVLVLRSLTPRRGVAGNAPAAAARTAMVFGLLLILSLAVGGIPPG